ncbi:MAG TPA: bifunctional riboflavin kinase/FAD synthetase [Verrucomicrobiae bacterium]
MKIIRSARELETGGRKVSLAIGFFDGVHLGHQQVIRQTISDARQQEGLALVVTFDRHPAEVIAPDRVPSLIYTQQQRIDAISSLGADALLLLPFDEAFSRVDGESFVRGLASDLGRVHSVCVGENFVFGHKRSGDVALLRHLGKELRFTAHGLEAVSLGNEAVSSTRVREVIRKGELDMAGQLLGRDYSLAGAVISGDQVGRKLGFPTANLDVRGRVTPPNGVYAAHAKVGGKNWRAAVNIGMRPTLREPKPVLHVEAHLLDFTADIYGQSIELSFVEKLRDEQRFPSLDALKEQISSDIQQVRELFASCR